MVNTRRQQLFSGLWTRKRADADKNSFSAGIRRLILLALVLFPWIGLGAVLLYAIDMRAREALQNAALVRASIAAALLDHRVSDRTRAVDWLQATPQANGRTTAGSASNSYGVQFRARDSALNVIAPASFSGSAPDELSEAAQSAAKSALATKMPRITSYVDDGGSGGLNLWLPLFRDGRNPILLQANLPASFLNDTVKDLESRGHWRMAIIGFDGAVLARLDGRDDQNGAFKKAVVGSVADFAPTAFYVVATSKISPFGFRVRAATPLAPLEAASRRNWAGFFIVTCLLTAVTLAAEKSIFQKRASKGGARKPELHASTGNAVKRPRRLQSGLVQTGTTPGGLSLKPMQKSLGEERLREALDAGGICVWEWRRPNNTVVWENSCAKLLRQSADMPPPTVRALVRRTFPHERRRLLHAIRMSLADGRPLSIDVRLTCFDGEQRWIALRANPINSEAGRVAGFVGIANDITDQKRGLSRTDALLREVSHRSKNMLALILAMARLTARDAFDVKSYLKEFTLRVAGLAASQDLIVAADWQSVDFATLASAEVEAVVRSDASRIKISGPPLLVTPEAAQTLGMILTELALNAAEHGALSAAAGEVHLSWSFPNTSTIKISWHETGGPTYDADRPKGYGLSVIERFSSQGLKLESRIGSDGESVSWMLEGPLAHVGMRSTPLPT
ncbi:signal transduction histidine kinase [Hyphomicrobium denitrificans 1NES1]|uniref:Blue-light-activated histidine kinase n=1 Tax=Hyphomicrobium denitrificans 1NES1 TaxID=670307 RepID=N0BA13_9HYPH|nr:HWE histidine kinase domain-containing protein [Hyphomicrobium denitrificans]AGK59082.1 signal transduction histidine kinase [Hyphomicrobium denitrificans 1NES1]